LIAGEGKLSHGDASIVDGNDPPAGRKKDPLMEREPVAIGI
jgi:hypothetical protein